MQSVAPALPRFDSKSTSISPLSLLCCVTLFILQGLNANAAGFPISIEKENGNILVIRSTRQVCPATALSLEVFTDLNH